MPQNVSVSTVELWPPAPPDPSSATHHVVPQALGQLFVPLYGEVEAVVSEEGHIDFPVLLRETQNIHSWPSVISAKPQAVAVAPGSSVSHSSRRDASRRFICRHDTDATLRTGRRGGSACFRKGWSTTAKSSLKKRLLFRSSSSRLYQQEKNNNNSSTHLSVG